MAQLVYSDPTYLLPLTSPSFVSLSPETLHLVNATLDELLHITIHAILLSPSPKLPLTIERFKSTFQRIVGLQLGKECLLEAELAVRELLRRSGNGNSIKADPALSTSTDARGSSGNHEELGKETAQLDETTTRRIGDDIFASLREWVMQISGFGALCPPTGPANLTTHLSELIAYRHPPSPSSSSPHISFLLTLYIERTLSTLTLHFLESITSIVQRRSTSSSEETATVNDLEIAFKEDVNVWNVVREMKVAKLIEFESIKSVEGLRSPTFGNGFMQLQQQQQQGRKGSISSSTIGGRNGLGIRRGSVDSTRSMGTNGFGMAPSSAGSGGGSGAMSHRRKPSLALSTVQSINSNLSHDDPFDQFLNSGQTMKLSMTPDRLRIIELEKARKQASQMDLRRKAAIAQAGEGATSIPQNSNEGNMGGDQTTNGGGTTVRRKLKARGPQQKDVFNEEDEDSSVLLDDDSQAERKKKPTTTQSLMDLLNSPPPWSGETVPGGVPMEAQSSLDTVSSGMTRESSQTSTSGGEEAWVNVSPQKRQKGLKAKDEKRDLASERQINNDLVSFFRNSPPTSIMGLPPPPPQVSAPPPTSYPSYPTAPPASPPLAGKKSKGGLRGFMSKVTGGGSANPTKRNPPSEDPSIPPPNPFMSETPYDDPIPPPRPRMRSISAQSYQSFGATSQATSTTTYALPPGLGDTPEKNQQKRRSGIRDRQRSESFKFGNRGGEQLAPRSSAPTLAPTSQPPVSILKTNSKRSSHSSRSQNSDSTALPPPVPLPPPIPVAVPPLVTSISTSGSVPTVIRPQRSSSLKRSHRSRETSAASTTSTTPSSTTLGKPPRPPPRVAKTSVSPVVIVPTGLAISSPDDEDENVPGDQDHLERFSFPREGGQKVGVMKETTNHMPEAIEPQPQLAPRSTTPSSPVKLRQLLLVDSSSTTSSSSLMARRNSTGVPKFNPAPRNDQERALSPSPSPSPSSLLFDIRNPQDRIDTPSSLSALGLTGVGAGDQEGQVDSMRKVLENLRERMEGTKSREECLDLVDALIAEMGTTTSRRDVNGVKAVSVGVTGSDESRMVEHYLEG